MAANPTVESPLAPASPAIDAPTASSPATCPNCGALVQDAYCGSCGQRVGAHLLSMREILADVVEDQFSVNGTALRTVVPLITRPGFLTREYLDGRIVRYVPPFRTFLVGMAVWLLAVTWQVQRQQPKIERQIDAAIAKERAREVEQARRGLPVKPFQIVSLPVDTARLPAFARGPLRPVARRYAEINAMDPGKAATLVVAVLLRSSSRLFLLLMPISAGLLKLVYVRKRRLFAEHFVFTLHLHAFWFTMMALLTLLPSSLWVSVPVYVWLAGYALLAMKRAYGDGLGGALLHCALFGALYFGLINVLSPVVTAVLLMTA